MAIITTADLNDELARVGANPGWAGGITGWTDGTDAVLSDAIEGRWEGRVEEAMRRLRALPDDPGQDDDGNYLGWQNVWDVFPA